MDFRNKTDSDLITEFKDLVAKERQLQTKILRYLRIIENRKIYLALGYSSLFVFLTEEIGYSESTVYRRIQAMRLIKDMPEVEEKLQKGKLSLSVASQFQGFLKKENQKRKINQEPKLSQQEKRDLLTKIEGTSVKKCEQKLVEINPELAIPKEKIRPITPENTVYQFTANKKLHRNIERFKNLTSHQNPEGKLEMLFEKLVEIGLKKLDPIQRQQRRIKREKAQAPRHGAPKSPNGEGGHATNKESKNLLSTLKVDRYISPKLRDKIWVRDKGQCQFRHHKRGNICGSGHMVEIDHHFPFSLGGENNKKNLQLRCRAHNQYQSDLIFSN